MILNTDILKKEIMKRWIPSFKHLAKLVGCAENTFSNWKKAYSLKSQGKLSHYVYKTWLLSRLIEVINNHNEEGTPELILYSLYE